jgi:Uma2 family endonuclease
MVSSAPRRATYDDLRRLPDDVLGQIVDGELVASPRPGFAHVHAASVLGIDLGGPFGRGRGGPGGWWILDEPELHLDSDVLVPDLAGWRRERLPSLPQGAFTKIAPDWVCEILSPSTVGVDRIKKLPIYARHNVKHAWLIDPVAHTLEVLRREGAHWFILATHGNTERVRAEPFESVEIELGALWLAEAEPPSNEST